MKGFLPLLLLCSPAFAATYQMGSCGSQPAHRVDVMCGADEDRPCCPPELSSPTAAIVDDTTAEGRADTTVREGTGYACVTESATPPATFSADVEDNTGCVGYSSTAIDQVQIRDEKSSLNDSNTTSHTVDLPDTVSADDLLLCAGAVDAGNGWGHTFPTGWTRRAEAADANNVALVIGYRQAVGDEGGTSITVDTNSAETSAFHCWAIDGWDPNTTISVTAASNTAGSQASSLTPAQLALSGAADERVFIALASIDAFPANSVTAYPSGYDSTGTVASSGTESGYARLAWAEKIATLATDTPGAFQWDTTDFAVAYTIAVSAPRFEFPAVTGLTAGTDYYMHIGQQFDGRHDFDVVTSGVFTTTGGGGGGGSDLTGLVYVADSTATGSDTGQDVTNAWPSLDDITGIPPGGDLCLMAGSVFEDEQLDVTWGGVDTDDRAIVGTCYEDSGALYWWWEGPSPRSATRAEVNGTFDQACIDGGDNQACDPDSGTVIPSGVAKGLVRLAGSYITIRALKIHDSAGRGLTAGGTASNLAQLINVADYITLEDSDIENVYNSAFLHLGFQAHRFIIRNNTFLHSGYRYSTTWNTSWSGGPGGACWQAGLGSHRDRGDPAYGLIEGNIQGDCSGEGYALLESSNNIVRGNIGFNLDNKMFYPDNAGMNVIEWNIFAEITDICDVEGRNADCSDAAGGANYAQVEERPPGCSHTTVGQPYYCTGTTDAEDNVMRQNALLYITLGASMKGGPNNENIVGMGKYILNNLLWTRGELSRGWDERVKSTQQLQTGVEVTNNIFDNGPSGGHRCYAAADSPAYLDNAFNQSSGGVDQDCRGTGDEYSISVSFAGWNGSKTTYAGLPTFTEMALQSGSSGYGTATDLTTTNIPEIDSLCSEFPQLADLDPTNGPIAELQGWTPTCSNWRKKVYYCADGTRKGVGCPMNKGP